MIESADGARYAVGNRASWDAPEASKFDDFIYVWQDKHIDMKRVIQRIKNATRALSDKWNPYLQEELFHGRSAKEVETFIADELKPLLNDMATRGVTIGEFEQYLHARHAEERNVQIASINPNMPDGGSGMDTAIAQTYLLTLDPAKRRTYEALAARVDTINKTTQRILVAYGLESADTIDTWNATYQHYVPLRRADMESGSGIGTGFSVRGPASKRAMGSTREVADILANVALNREKAIVRGEKNRVAMALYGLAKLNPNADFWKADAPPMAKVINPSSGLVERHVDPLYKTRDNVVVVRLPKADGSVKENIVTFNQEDERAMRMSRSLKNLDMDDIGTLLGISAKITRYIGQINTQYNPVFGVVNLVRDVQGAALNLSSTPIAGKEAAVLGGALSAIRGIYVDMRAIRSGTHPPSMWAREFEEFQREGGQTGYRDLFTTSRERGEAIEREFRRISEGGVKTAGRAILEWLSDYNSTMENATRLSAYKVAKEAGLSKQQAASLAKNITVNFNRKGQITRQAGALYAFFNASVQGTARIAETLSGPAGAKIITGGLLVGVLQALWLAAAGFDDDEPPQFVRERNLVIPIGDKQYITIPMPLGFHVLPNIGRIATEFTLSGFRDKAKRASQLFSVFAEAFNPLGSSGLSLQTIAPAAIDPIAALAENKDWTGKPIAREDFSKLAQTPGHTRAMATASEFSKVVSKAINWLSGGTNYKPGIFSPTPDQIDYLIGQGTGGLGREIMKVEQTVTSSVTGEELPLHKIPMVGRFYGSAAGQTAQSNQFYVNLKAINEHEAEIRGRRKANEPVREYITANPEAKLIQTANEFERRVSEARKVKRALVEKRASRERIKAVDNRITLMMKQFNELAQKARASKPPEKQLEDIERMYAPSGAEEEVEAEYRGNNK